MGCNIQQAIELLNTIPATKGKLKSIFNADKLLQKEFAGIVKSSYGTKEPTLKDFRAKFSDFIFSEVMPEVRTDDYAFTNILKSLNGIELARFDSDTNTITIQEDIDAVTMRSKVAKEFYSEFLKDLDDKTANTIFNTNEFQEPIDTTVSKIFDIIEDSKGTDFLLHELVHSGVKEFMGRNPNEPSTLRVQSIYQYALANSKYLGLEGINSNYWKTNVDEFIAEALSNDDIIIALASAKPAKPVKKLTSLLTMLHTAIAVMLGKDKNTVDNLFSILLDSSLTMINKSYDTAVAEDDAAELQRMHEEDLASKDKEAAKISSDLSVKDDPGWDPVNIDTGFDNEEEQYFGDDTTLVNTNQKVTGVPKVNGDTIAKLDKSINDLDKMSTILLTSMPKALQAILKGKC
jgi:hypothetical protein